ncbi:MAG TPA: acylphosphatase [Rhodanobacteraceae bacterium]|jgi:acylphosphatase|nr:acylphosphatase [Rhodanobacteraceae bacterium]
MTTVRFVVSGRVQGVFFRASTRAEAQRLGIAGSARNLDDGRVEVIAVGSDEALGAFERWLWQGPPSARVDAVAREGMVDRHAEGFRVL